MSSPLLKSMRKAQPLGDMHLNRPVHPHPNPWFHLGKTLFLLVLGGVECRYSLEKYCFSGSSRSPATSVTTAEERQKPFSMMNSSSGQRNYNPFSSNSTQTTRQDSFSSVSSTWSGRPLPESEQPLYSATVMWPRTRFFSQCDESCE